MLAVRRRWLTARLPARGPADARLFGRAGLAVVWTLADGCRLTLLANLSDEPVGTDATARPRGRLIFDEPASAADARAAERLGPWTVHWYVGERAV